MPNVLKQVQDLGGICWDKYISGSGLNALYINSKLDECAVKQINFNSNFPIETGIDGYFNNTKIFTDYKNNYFAQKTTTAENQFSINFNTSSRFGDFKIGDLLNTNNNIFNEINLHTDIDESNINFLNSSTKDIFIDTSDIPNNATAKFRCIKFDPKETERTCIKILSTKEILLKCCGSGEQGIGGGGGAGGGDGGGGSIGGEGLIGIGGPTAFGSDGIIGIDGPMYLGTAPQGLDGQVVQGADGSVGLDGPAVEGSQGQNGDSNSAVGSDGIIGIDGPAYVGTGPQGLDGQVVRGDDGSVGLNNEGVQGLKGPDGDVGNTINGTIGIQGLAAVPNPAILQGDGGVDGVGASIGMEGPVGIQNQGPFFPPDGIRGVVGQDGIKSPLKVDGSQGVRGEAFPQNGTRGEIGRLGPVQPISTYVSDGYVNNGRLQQRLVIYGITGFLNPFNKNDTTNNPVRGTINNVIP